MSDVPTGQPPAVAPSSTPTNGENAQTPASNGTPGVTLEQVQATVQTAIQAALNPVFAQVRKLSAPATPESKSTEQTWQDQVKEKLARSERQMRSTAITQAAAANGIPPERVGIFKDVFSARHGNDIKVIARGDEDVVIHVDQLGTETPLKDAVATFLRTSDGELFKPAVQTPRSNIQGGTGSHGTTQIPYGELPQEERDKLIREGKAGAYIKADMASGR